MRHYENTDCATREKSALDQKSRTGCPHPPFYIVFLIMPEAFCMPDGHLNTRSLLRQATKQAHSRLHDHQGLGALAAGKIDTAGYVKLLLELLPLHRLVEERLSAFTEKPCLVWRNSIDRIECSAHLCADLRFLGVSSVDVP